MQVRYRYRISPTSGTISDTKVQRRVITLAKATPERAWRGEVTSVALVQACRYARRVPELVRLASGQAVADAGWSQLMRCIQQKAAQYGRGFSKIGRFEPTSQVCSDCGVRDGPKPLSIREWVCAACGMAHDRDVNAARNILAAGGADRLNACEAGVRPPLTVAGGAEAGTHRSVA